MKITFLINDISHIGGVERVIVTLANYFASKLKYDVEIISLFEKQGINSNLVLDKQIKTKFLNYKKREENKYLGMYKEYKVIKSMIKSLDTDYLITLYTMHNIYGALAKKNLKGKIIGCQHGQFYMDSSKYNFLKKKFFNRLDQVVLLTERDNQIYKQFCSKTRVIENPIPFKSEYIYNEEAKRILVLGRLDQGKSVDYTIKAFAKIANDFPNWILEIVGEGPEKENLLNLIKNLKIEKSVDMQSFTSNVKEKYKNAAFTVLSSQTEALPMVLIESKAYGIPSVSFDTRTGPREIINDKEDGFLVQKNDIDDLSEKMKILIEDSELRKSMSVKAFENSSRFSIESIASKWIDLFENLK